MLLNRTNFKITKIGVVWFVLVDVCLFGNSKQEIELEKGKRFRNRKK